MIVNILLFLTFPEHTVLMMAVVVSALALIVLDGVIALRSLGW